METDESKLYDSSEFFFKSNGSALMRLTPDAAVEVCNEATKKGVIVWRVEGGIWRNSLFEARVDCIWDGIDPPLIPEEVKENNDLAANFIASESDSHNAFILTVTTNTYQ